MKWRGKPDEQTWLWTQFCIRGLWEDEMFARPVLWNMANMVAKWWGTFIHSFTAK